MSQDSCIVKIVLPVPIHKVFDYELNLLEQNVVLDDLSSLIGCRVLVPFGNKTMVGLVQNVSHETSLNAKQIKPVINLIDQEPVVDSNTVTLLNWASQYYHHPIGDVWFTALPKWLKEGRDIDELNSKALFATDNTPLLDAIKTNAINQKKLVMALAEGPLTRERSVELGIPSATISKFVDQGWAQWQSQLASFDDDTATIYESPLQLNKEQAIAIASLQNSQTKVALLEGVTGSGKTEVYLQLIEEKLRSAGQIAVLVPEIGLTPQTVARFAKRFGQHRIAIWHSGMTDKQRAHTWLKMKTGQASILIATRSGVFLPFKKLSLIIMDEEHDGSFKQQDGFKYHCRSIALYRAKLLDIPVLLGSATPSLETYQNARAGKFLHLSLMQRATGAALPKLRLLDLNQCQVQAGIGQPLLERIRYTLDNHQQVMLFINRRGFAPVIMCEECHWLSDCNRCSSYTTYHKAKRQLICHHCGDQQWLPTQCKCCGSSRLTSIGVGTEQLDEQLSALFPDHPVIRLDRDTTANKGSMDALLETINSDRPMIIVGTQMVAKGHHFNKLGLVGIVDVDGSLYSSDFRAPEKLAQLVVQVSGRAGRMSGQGEVWLQSRFPDHPVIQDLLNNHYRDFAKITLDERQLLQLPPFSHQIIIRAEALNEQDAYQWLYQLSMTLQDPNVQVFGPVPAPMFRRAGKFRFILTLQSTSRNRVHAMIDWLIEHLDRFKNNNRIRWSIDVDPVDLS